MRRSVLLALACLLSSGTLATSSKEDLAAVEPGVSLANHDGWSRQSIAVSGRLVSYALPMSADGTRELYLLVAPDDPTLPGTPKTEGADEGNDEVEKLPPCPAGESARALALQRVDPDAPNELSTVRDDIPNDAEALDAADLDGDGRQELLLARRGVLSVVTRTGGQRTLLEDADLAWSSVHPRATESPRLDGRALVATTPLGHVTLFGPRPDDEGWHRLAEAEMPLRGRVNRGSVSVSNRIPQFVGARDDGTLLFASWPEEYGKLRLGVTLIAISPSGVSESLDCWARLPEPEDVLERHFLMVDHRPMMLVTTKPAGKLSLFGEKRLRLYGLDRDRSRLGRPPVYVAESRMNLWQEATPMMLDVDGDGREDLVIGYWKGLKDDKIVIDAYLRHEDGWFAGEPKTTAFNVVPAKREPSDRGKLRRPKPDRSFLLYGRDLDGDSLPDLLLRTPSGLLVFRGNASTDGENLVRKSALELPSTADDAIDLFVTVQSEGIEMQTLGGPSLPRLADLDGDGAMEILTFRRGLGPAPDLLEIVRLEP
jgi:hypothetical protein